MASEVFLKTAFFFQGSAVLLPGDIEDIRLAGEISLDRLDDFKLAQGESNESIAIDCFEIPAIDSPGISIRGLVISPHVDLPPSWRAVPVRQGLSLLASGASGENEKTDRLLRAFHIAQWRRESRFCGSCGAKNTDSASELSRLCPVCGRLEYPRISPAVITLITNDRGQVLLAHNKKFNNGVYSLIAGFNEAGENLEATVAREIREEVNIEVRDVRYIVSQPWPFPNSLMLGFSASHAGGEIKPDGVEIADARWWGREELPPLPGKGSVARHLIELWLSGAL